MKPKFLQKTKKSTNDDDPSKDIGSIKKFLPNSHQIPNSNKSPLSFSNKLTEALEFWNNPAHNRPNTYSISCPGFEEFQSTLGNRYIGPKSVLIITRKPNDEIIELKIGNITYCFDLPSLIIPGISLDDVEIVGNSNKCEISILKFHDEENQVSFLPMGNHARYYFSRSALRNEPMPGKFKMSNLRKQTVDKLKNTFSLTKLSSPRLPQIEIEDDQELDKLFSILKGPLVCSGYLNCVMKGSDLQHLANIILSHHVLEKQEKNLNIFQFFSGENFPTEVFELFFVEPAILEQLIEMIKKTFSSKYTPNSVVCLIMIQYFNFVIHIKVKIQKTQTILTIKSQDKPESSQESIEVIDFKLSIQKLKELQEDDPFIRLTFQPFLGPADRNIVGNLFEGYCSQHKNTDFIFANDRPVGEFFTPQNMAPGMIATDYTHSDVLVAFLCRLENEARNRNWVGQALFDLNITASNMAFTLRIGFF